MKYKLLTPGPLTTSASVKEVMMFDHCTWDHDYKQITQNIRAELLALAHVSEPEYTCVLMQGSGTFGVESVCTSIIKEQDCLLILANGAYGERIAAIAQRAHLPYRLLLQEYDKIIDVNEVAAILADDPAITHIAMVHSETTTGIMNDLRAIGDCAHHYGKTFIVDAMSSFGGVDINLEELHIDFLISSANKCIQGVPGFSFILANTRKLMDSAGTARSLSLDLYDQWLTMQKDGKWRFTSPTHTVLAFAQALQELKEEGGVVQRAKRYAANHALLIEKLSSLGFDPYIKEHQGPIITTFCILQDATYDFQALYDYFKERGYAIYPGKLTDADTFRIGNIGEIYEEDIMNVYQIMKQFLKKCETV